MGDKATLAKAKKELEDLYLGVPDDSVNLTFQDFAQVRQEKKKFSPSPSIQPIPEKPGKATPPSPLAKLPSLDFSKGLEASFQRPINNGQGYGHNGRAEDARPWAPGAHHAYGHDDRQHGHHHAYGHDQHHGYGHDHGKGSRNVPVEERSMAYDDMSHMSGVSVGYGLERGGRRRPGIPHSNVCTVCSNYIYIFRHRCLVCGRVYCRQCVSTGMGEMTEGRKCIECLGRRFSQRYIKKAGSVGCCMGYPSLVKQQELKWAEKGPRRSGGENRYGNSVMVSRSRSPMGPGRSPMGPGTPTRQHSPTTPPSFVMNSPYSPYSPTDHHPMPF